MLYRKCYIVKTAHWELNELSVPVFLSLSVFTIFPLPPPLSALFLLTPPLPQLSSCMPPCTDYSCITCGGWDPT